MSIENKEKKGIKNKKKAVIVFLVVVAVIAVLLFADIGQDDTGEGEEETSVTKESALIPETSPEESSIDESEAEQEAEINKETSFWFWSGDSHGVPCSEYLTLRGDETYILRIELEGHEAVDETGKYKLKGEDVLQIWINGKRQTGTLKGNRIQLDEKVYKQSSCDHV